MRLIGVAYGLVLGLQLRARSIGVHREAKVDEDPDVIVTREVELAEAVVRENLAVRKRNMWCTVWCTVRCTVWCTVWCTMWCTMWCMVWCTAWCTVWITEQKWKLCSLPWLPQPTCRKSGK